MGTKTPGPMTLRKQTYVCNICDRRFWKHSALITHKNFRHTNQSRASKRASLRASGLRTAKRSPITPVAKKNTKMTPSKSDTKNISKEANEKEKKESVVRKIEFKCPKCVKIFSVYFSAYRHIQKHHCVDENGEPVAPNSSNIIKPVRVELCPLCSKWFQSSDSHECDKALDTSLQSSDSTDATSDSYMCVGCQKTFDGVRLFEGHVRDSHCRNVESLFFPSSSEFSSWKKDLEEITKTKYNSLSTNDKSKKVYHCSYQHNSDTDKKSLCPASLYLSEYKTGFQVTYYKDHSGHSSPESDASKYKNYLLKEFVPEKEKNTEANVYQVFKSVMEGVLTSAVNVEIGVLNTLLGKAYDMAHLLNCVNGVTEQVVVKKNMSDEQISEVLSEVKTYTNKRKTQSLTMDAKKPKLVENDENLAVTDKKTELISVTPRPVLMSPPLSSFNDSYKDFIESTTNNSNSSTPRRTPKIKKEVVKTKIGQFKVRTSLSPKTPDSTKTKDIDDNKLNEVIKPKKTYSKKIATEIVKPKIRPSFVSKLKPDFEYIVKERENDCNILILKI